MKKRVLSLLLTLSLLAIPLHGTSTTALAVTEENTAAEAPTETSISSDLNKLHFYFDVEEYATIDSLSELNEAAEYVTQKVETANLTSNVSANASADELRLTIGFASDIKETQQYKDFLAERETLESMEEVREFRHRLNTFSKAYHRELISQKALALANIEYKEFEMIEYSPYVVMKTKAEDLDTASLAALASNEEVESICVAGSLSIDSSTDQTYSEAAIASSNDIDERVSLDVALQGINASTVVANQTYTGEGIRIGVLEDEGICYSEYPLFPENMSITIDPRYSSAGYSLHASSVMGIIATMAPNAEYYVSLLGNVFSLEWFIDNGCDVINISAGHNGTNEVHEYREDTDAVCDYQIDINLMAVTTSAGNRGNQTASPITSPGYAFNVITVGGTKYSSGEWIIDPISSYNTEGYPEIKPNVVAPCFPDLPDFPIYDKPHGTSYAVPFVTGSIALLMEKDSGYVVYPEKVLSLITATAQKTHDYATTESTTTGYFDNKLGAGMIDLQKMLNNSSLCIEHTNNVSGYSYGKVVMSEELYISSIKDLQIGLAWLAHTDDEQTITDVFVTDYDIYLINTWGDVVVADSTLVCNNVELIRYKVELSGTYRIEVRQYSQAETTDYLALSYTLS